MSVIKPKPTEGSIDLRFLLIRFQGLIGDRDRQSHLHCHSLRKAILLREETNPR